MRYHIAVKFIAIALAALSLLAVVGSCAGVIGLASLDLYDTSVDALYEEEMAAVRRDFAVNLTHRYASIHLGSIPEAYLRSYHSSSWLYDTFAQDRFFYAIKDETGAVVESTLPDDLEGASKYVITVTEIRYRRLVTDLSSSTDTGSTEAAPESGTGPSTQEPEPSETPEATPPSESVTDTGIAPLSEEEQKIRQDGYFDYEQDIFVELCYQYATLPPYTVELYLLPGAIPQDPMWSSLKILWNYRYELFWVLGIALLAFAVTAVYLCCAAGRKPKQEGIRPGGLNCIPLDLYGTGVFLGLLLAVSLSALCVSLLASRYPELVFPFLFFAGYGICLVVVGFLYACVAQLKAPNFYWWRHSIVGFIAIRIYRLIRKLLRGGMVVMGLLPVIWQWLLTAFLMVMAVAISFLLAAYSPNFVQPLFVGAFFLSILGCVGVVCYGGYCFGVLIRGAQIMARGNLYYQIPTKYLLGSFRDFALQLNSLAGAAQIAAERQLRSERMKTELITNVSHDIKTPLTSIINYVDLLKKPHSPEEDQQYLEVLDRQSQRLKKLIEDLMDMSKASTGNMNVELSRMDAAETLNQVLGEFSDKLERVGLSPVFRAPEDPVFMLADGKLVWRVMSNLLSNAVKYAMPNTRLYVDLMEIENRVIISMKNISREELNVRADELLERFVRGDLSRNTEGSGLGLNIAQSLMELQKGQLQLLVDGDLFKVTLIFPKA